MFANTCSTPRYEVGGKLGLTLRPLPCKPAVHHTTPFRLLSPTDGSWCRRYWNETLLCLILDNSRTVLVEAMSNNKRRSLRLHERNRPEISESHDAAGEVLNFSSWTVVQLRKELKTRGLHSSGLKADLVIRGFEMENLNQCVLLWHVSLFVWTLLVFTGRSSCSIWARIKDAKFQVRRAIVDLTMFEIKQSVINTHVCAMLNFG